MKFGDKLVELRKKNGYSQEELAEKLGVSRQSVSKWESNNTYPETDKIVQIANIFDCSMDDLINDKITDVETTLRKNKNNIYNMWDSLLEFITKTINMFSKMKFLDGFKCIIEMIIVALILALLGRIICSAASSAISSIFSFLSDNHVLKIKDILESIFDLIWLIIAVIALVHTFKIRYLNYYDKENSDKENENKDNNSKEKDNNSNNTQLKNNEKIIIRDEKDKPFAFLGALSKIVIIFIKFITFWFLLGTVFTTIGLVVSDVVSMAFIPTNIIFLWLTIMLIAATVVSVQIIILLICFIFNKKVSIKKQLIIFVSSIIVFGLSLGMTFLSFRNIEFKDDNSVFNLKTKEIIVDYKDNLFIKTTGMGRTNEYKYIIDNSVESNKIILSKEVDTKYFKFSVHESKIDKMPVLISEQDSKGNFKIFYNLFVDNLKKNKIYTLENYGNDPLVIRANEETINNLLQNLKKVYLVEEKVENDGISIKIHGEKVVFSWGLEGEYNAVDDTLKYNKEGYSCKKEIEKTEYGERIIYTCNYQEINNQ
ncbi:MAG: helix-turn-helix transcriptional regulator [Bacilli bacterium]|nr:helix-turn-helix transcriptional regulator [Bacilli bacterium]